MGNISVTAYLVAGVHDDNAPFHFIGKDTGNLPQLGGFADARLAQYQDGFAAADNVVNDVYGAFERPANPAGQANDLARPAANAADAVKGSLDACPVVFGEIAEPFDDMVNVFFDNDDVGPSLHSVKEAGFEGTSVIEDNLNEGPLGGGFTHALLDRGRENRQKLRQAIVVLRHAYLNDDPWARRA